MSKKLSSEDNYRLLGLVRSFTKALEEAYIIKDEDEMRVERGMCALAEACYNLGAGTYDEYMKHVQEIVDKYEKTLKN